MNSKIAIITIFLFVKILAENDVQGSACLEKPETGMCRGMFPRFFYNPTSKKCEEFIYGGCGGNHNNFETQNECEHQCIKKHPSILYTDDNVNTRSGVGSSVNHTEAKHGKANSAMDLLLNPYLLAMSFMSFLQALCLEYF